jgi:tungstate transport system substrate-binding protein
MIDSLELDIVVEGDTKLFNQYGVIAVDPKKNDKINAEGAQAFVDWMISDKAQNLIKEFGKDKYGQSLFIPNAKK